MNLNRCLMASVLLAVLLAVIIALLPSPIDPVDMDLGDIECKSCGGNADLRQTVKLFHGEISGPEGFAVDGDGNMYTGLHDGRVVKFTDNSLTTVFRLGPPPYDNCGENNEESRCGRVLGLEISPVDPYLLYMCDCYHGISTFHLKTGERKTLVNTSLTYPGIHQPILFANDMVVLTNGSVFFTDSSYKFARNELLYDVTEGRPNGRLLHYNPLDDTLTVALTDLYFANGLCVNANEEFLTIVETTKARILKYYLKGSKAGQRETFVDNLPGLPDNVSPSSSGGFWVGFAFLRSTFDQTMGHYPSIRNVCAKLRIVRMIAHLLPKNGLIIEYDENGQTIRELYDMGGVIVESVSEILDVGDNILYLGSYEQNYIGKLNLSDLEA